MIIRASSMPQEGDGHPRSEKAEAAGNAVCPPRIPAPRHGGWAAPVCPGRCARV